MTIRPANLTDPDSPDYPKYVRPVTRRGPDRRHAQQPPYFGERRTSERRNPTWADTEHRSVNR